MMTLLRNPIAHYIALTAIFFVLILALPAQQTILNAYKLSSMQYHILLFLYVLPFIGIWYAAFLAFKRLYLYSQSVKGSVEGTGYRTLALGCGWLAYSLPITAIIGLILYTFENSNLNVKPTAVILSNYLNLITPLIGFMILSAGARRLIKSTKMSLSSNLAKRLGLFFVGLGLVYGYFILKDIDSTSLTSVQNGYFLPIWLVIFSLIIPYLYSWFIGLEAAIEMIFHARNSKGLLYRQALSYVGYGVATVILSSVFVQFLDSISTSAGNLSINYAFVTAYFAEMILAVGYTLIAVGSSKLQRIEEV